MSIRRPLPVVASLLALSLAAAACSGGSTTETPEPEAPAQAAEVSFGIQGTADELAAWKQVIGEHNESSDKLQASVVEWKRPAAVREAISTGDLPDVFLARRSDLGLLQQQGRIQPVTELLDERGVDFGDRFSRDALNAFGMNGELQCMAYSISPTVMFLNTDLVNFDEMAEEDLRVPSRTDRWNLAEFTAAAEYASSASAGTVGFHVEPTVAGLAPFILSGGGEVIDDDRTPSSLTFSTNQTRDALGASLGVLRNASLTLGEEQLAQNSALEWFKEGNLGMIAGQRSLVPELRAVTGLNFDVMPMPRADAAVTIGEVTGLCIARNTTNAAAAADLIAHLVGDEPTTLLAQTGATQPANLAVTGSDDFLQPDQQPANAEIFNSVVRGMHFTPLVESWADVEKAVSGEVTALLREPGEIDLEEMTTLIDMASAEFFNPGSTQDDEQGDEDEDPESETP